MPLLSAPPAPARPAPAPSSGPAASVTTHGATRRRTTRDPVSNAVVRTSKWAAFACGLGIFVAVALIPPATDLDAMRRQRDRVLAMERTDLDRLANYRAMLDALDRNDPDTLRLVLASELQLVPRDRTALIQPGQPEDPRLFELLEPTPRPLPASTPPAVPSALARLANDDRGRLLLLAIAGLAVLWGLLPPLEDPMPDNARP